MYIRSRFVVSLLLVMIAGLAMAAGQWIFQPRHSELIFVATQAGAPFEGKFEKFTADINFDPKNIAASRFEVRIDLSSVNSRDAERDDILKGPDLFAVEKWPTAIYVAESFKHQGGNKFSAAGKLTLRGVTRPVPIEFIFDTNATGASLKGSAKIKRLDFGVGQGEWKDTSGVANEVTVRYSLALSNSEAS